jgi:acetylornithine deacetylase/succinyl-diaminopimelate desuccinylase-like protein
MDSLTELLKSLVATDTRYSTKSEKNLASMLETLLKDANFSIERVATGGRFNILADNNKSGKAILFYGHIDTVDVASGWTRDPFALTVEGNKGFGLGAYDMKGGMAAFLTAIQDAPRHVKILLAVDEENISAGSWDVVQQKGNFFEDVELVISAEPNFGLGMHSITRGRTGRVIFTVVSKGKPSHIAKYTEGLNAIYPLVTFVSLIEKTDFHFGKMTVLQPRNIRTNTVGMSLCEQAEVDVEVLLGSEDSIESVLNKLTHSANSVEGALSVVLAPRKTPYLTGYYFENFPLQKTIATIIKQFTGKSMQLHERSSVGDDNVLATLGIPVITWGPNGDGAHESDEWVNLKDLNLLSQMFHELLQTT